MRAVGDDAAIIAADAPEDIVGDLVEQIVGTSKLAGAGQIIVDDVPLDRRQIGRAGVTGDFDVPKTVISKTRLINFRADAFEGIAVRCLGRAQLSV